MVLLSFFVMYFSFAEENPNTVENQLQRIALSMKGLSEEQIKAKLNAKEMAEMSSLADVMKIAGVKVTQKEDHLVLELQQEFKSGDYRLNKELNAQLDAVLAALVPFHNKVDITIIGHADQRTMAPRNEFLQDNFDLSSIRALRALKYAISKGYPERYASARAASYFDRDARSLSVEVRLTNKPGGTT